MTLNPFVMGAPGHIQCFDEPSPCILEQTSMCVIDVASKKDAASTFPGQKQYIPWLSCMDSNGDKLAECNKQVGIDSADVQSCLKSDIQQLLKEYFAKDKPIRGTPTVTINGKNVEPSFKLIKAAICKADPSLAGCKGANPSNDEWEPEMSNAVPPHDAVIV